MTQPITSPRPIPSPFQFDNAPNGEADVDPDQIVVLDRPGKSTDGWGKNEFPFRNILGEVSLLHYIPMVSALYRNITGDGIAQALRALGETLFGGPIGTTARSLLATGSDNIQQRVLQTLDKYETMQKA